jgi:sarcosine oxidase
MDWPNLIRPIDYPPMTVYGAIILGAGGIGSAVLRHLSERGVKTVGIDRFRPPHGRGSSHGQTRVIRQAYFEHSNYVPLMLESYRMWRELEQRTGRGLFRQTGLVEVGPADGVVVPGVLRAAAEHGLAVENLSSGEIETRWPGLRVPVASVGVFEPTGGYLLVEDCVAAHLEAAAAAGAELRPGTEVIGWSATERDVRVRTTDDEIVGQRLIITAGAWAREVLADLKLRLEIRRKSLFWFETGAAEYDMAAGFPVFLYERPDGVFYGFPKLDRRGVKIGEHSGGRVVEDPSTVDRSVDAAEQQRLVEFMAAYLPKISQRVTDHAVCLYTMSHDEHFIIDRHPAHANVVFAAGLSGHGFKFAPVLGRALAELALDGGTELPIGFLALRRFA